MFVLGGSASGGIDIHLAKRLGADLGKVETTKFPDGEIKVRIPDIGGKRLIIVQSTCWPQEKNLFELLLTAQAAKETGVKITAVVPYLAYARQNRSFNPGESVSINMILDMIHCAGINTLITVNPHKSGPLNYFKGKVGIINCEKTLAESVKTKLSNPLVLAPDEGSLDMARRAAAVLECDYTYIEKHRDNYGAVSIVKTHVKSGAFNGKDVVIFDDIISTGSTIAQAARFAYTEGAATVSTAGIHLVMAHGSEEKLKNAGVERIFGTNTIPYDKAEIVDISEDVAECVKTLV